jgi:hypothetical protein
MFSLEFDYSDNIIFNCFPLAQKSRRPSGSIYDFPDRDEDLGVKTEFRRPKTPPGRPSTSKGKGEAGSTEPKSKKVRREFDGIDESPKSTKVRRESEIDISSIFDRFTFKKIILNPCNLRVVISISFPVKSRCSQVDKFVFACFHFRLKINWHRLGISF